MVAAYPARYGGTTLRELCDEMHAEVRARATIELLDRAFAELPVPATAKFPGFAHDIHGVERNEHGIVSIECLSNQAG
ncbi:MAG: hypothetical protein ABSB52_07575 [Acidimicrobiales bacterium]